MPCKVAYEVHYNQQLDAAYCYRWSSAVCLSVGHFVSPVKWLNRSRYGLGEGRLAWDHGTIHVLDCSRDPHIMPPKSFLSIIIIITIIIIIKG